MIELNKSKEISLMSYYKGLYDKYIPYISNRVWGSDENGYGNPLNGINAHKFDKIGQIFSEYVLRLIKCEVSLCPTTLGVFLYTQLINDLGRGNVVFTEVSQLSCVIEVVGIMLLCEGEGTKLSEKDTTLKIIEAKENNQEIEKDTIKDFSGVTRENFNSYIPSLTNIYKTNVSELVVEPIDKENIELYTLAYGYFGNKSILSYRIKGDLRGERPCNNWCKLYREVLDYFKQTYKDEFLDIAKRRILKGNKRVFLSYNKEDMRVPRDMGDGVFAESRLVPEQIKSLLSILFIDLGLSLDTLEINVLKGNSSKRIQTSI